MQPLECIKEIGLGHYDTNLKVVYGTDPSTIQHQRERYTQTIEQHVKLYPQRDDIEVYSASGRSEVGGNHTDHQHGCVLATAVGLDVIAVVAFHDEGTIRLKSKGYPMDVVELDDLSVHPNEVGKSTALIRGIVSKFSELGVKVGGFDAYTTSDVLSGSGLSSSAAFEVLVGTIIDNHYNAGKLGAVEIAKIGQYAENQYFGKKSGLMDQMVSSVGGFVFIDFESTTDPKIEKVSCDLGEFGLQLCITDTKGSHANLTDDYVAIPKEMQSVAKYFGKEYLREVDEDEFYSSIPKLRGVCSDRAILRSAHYFQDNEAAQLERDALSAKDIEKFLQLVRASGNSSARLLQNLYSCSSPTEQGIPLGLFVSERVLQGRGATRVHGGGFAGTIQAFVPKDLVSTYVSAMDNLFGKGSCYCLDVRLVGGLRVL
jgi:galactokinase